MGRKTTLNEDYFSWLCNLIRDHRHGYTVLCRELYNKTFRWHIHNDDNRCQDGLNLRELFIEEAGIDENHLEVRYFLKGECTVLEVLVALSKRINELMYDLNHQEDHTSKWFQEMISNLKLDEFTDKLARGARFTEVTEMQIDTLLEICLDRTYDVYGRGGLFPLKKRHPKDMATVEIWYQLMAYLDENYGL